MSEKRDERLEELLQEPQAVESETEKELQTQTDEHKSEKKNSALREVLSWCMTFVIAIALALVLKNYIIINATVPTGSMEHTIEPGDDLFGLRIAYNFTEPRRGDIIISRTMNPRNM